MEDRVTRLEQLFREALLLDPKDRPAFLEQACPDDPDLQRELEALLRADDRAESSGFMDTPMLNLPPASLAGADLLDGQQIGDYTVLHRIGRGGMGDVYLALRHAPFRQYVALKIVRVDAADGDMTRRFEMERQILASLNHPNIARLLDGGTTRDGRSFFVMEYVEGGVPITRYCDGHQLSLNERLHLFQVVCRTVHHAHQNLIVHRDLKPSNILVTNDGAVKLLDFGVAKLLNPNLAPVPMPVTRAEARVMTPEYASPEQVRGDTLTTASDIYALGVLLYELLTGHRPYRITSSSPQALQRIICELDPERPSSRIQKPETVTLSDGSEATITAETVSQARRLPPERLQRRLRGDLDNIVLMAMRKEPHQRYASAEQFAHDVQRYLDGQPTMAHRDSRRYRVKKFVTRHQVGVLAAAAFIGLLVLFSTVTAIQSAQLRARSAAVALERDRARQEAEKAQAVSEFLVGLFQMSDPNYALGETITARELLDNGSARIHDELAGQPALRGTLLASMGRVYYGLGLYDETVRTLQAALDALQQAYGRHHPEVALTMTYLGEALQTQGALGTSIETLREALALQREVLGPSDPQCTPTLIALATTLRLEGSYREAETLLEEALTLEEVRTPQDRALLATIFTTLGHIHRDQRMLERAEFMYRQALRLSRETYGDTHPNIANTVINLAAILGDQGKYDESEALFDEGLAMRRTLQGEDHPDVAIDLGGLGRLAEQRGDLALAETRYREALARLRQSFPPGNYRVTRILLDLSSVLMARHKPVEAEPLLQEYLTLAMEDPDPDPVRLANAQGLLGACLTAIPRYEEAERLLTTSYASLQRVPDAPEENLQAARERLVALYTTWGKPEEAARYGPPEP